MSGSSRASDDLHRAWVSFYREYHDEDLTRLASAYPEERSLYVDVLDLHEYDPEFTESVLSEPDRFLRGGREALADLHDGFDRVNVRLENHPGLLGAGDLRSRHVGELVTVEGVVADAGPVQSKVVRAVFRCRSCGHAVRTRPTGYRIAPPGRCNECDARDPFRLLEGRSDLLDVQRVGFRADSGESDADVREIDVFLDDDLVGTVSPGERLLVTGIVRLRREGDANRFALYVDANAVQEEHPAREEERDVSDALRDAIEDRWRSVVDD